MNSLASLAQSRHEIFWWVKSQDLANLSDESVVEQLLNYGDWSDVLQLVKVLGWHKTAEYFDQITHKPRTNLRPEIVNYFKNFFHHHALLNTKL